MGEGFIITLDNVKLKQRLEVFWDGDKFLSSLEECKETIEFFERVYPENKGKYKVYKVEEVE